MRRRISTRGGASGHLPAAQAGLGCYKSGNLGEPWIWRPAGTGLDRSRSACGSARRLSSLESMHEMNAASAGHQNASLGDEIVGRIDQLAAISETPQHLTRIFLTREHRAAAELLLSWMRSAGIAPSYILTFAITRGDVKCKRTCAARCPTISGSRSKPLSLPTSGFVSRPQYEHP